MAMLRIFAKLTWFVYLLIASTVVYELALSGDPNPARLFLMAVLALVVTPVVASMSIRRFLPKYGRDPADWPRFFSRKGLRPLNQLPDRQPRPPGE